MAGTPALEARPAEIVMPMPVTVEVAPGSTTTFSDLFRHFQADPSKVRAPKTQMIYDGLLWITSSVWGEDRLLTSIDRSACRELLDVLRWLPSNPAKRFPAMSAVQASRMAKKTGLKSTLSAGSINGYMAKLRALMTFAVNEGWIDRNPATGLTVADPVRDKDKRLPFSSGQLRLIFDAPLYRGCRDDGAGYAVSGHNRPRRARFWIPLIGLFSGMRLNEICQLDLVDIQHLNGVLCFNVRASSTEPRSKRLKTLASERLVPVHKKLVEVGFAQYVDTQRAKGCAKLFPELRPSSAGYYSDSFSKWFRRFLESAGAMGDRTCFHSFRHCFRDGLRAAAVSHEASLALGGWASAGSGQIGVSEAYGSGLSIEALRRAIDQIDYPELDLQHIISS